ncbi:hypothetical protein HJA69_000535 [Vibrio alginolyticus]|nr:hypothetical protein [Vibrio alginolyticus]EHK9602111.1 hypothetical protein [Vibrio alginolyticus]
MDGVLGGVISGLITSFLVGLFLLWKGDKIVLALKSMPKSWKVKYLTKVYLHAIKKNDHNFTHSIVVSFISAFFLMPVFFSISLYPKIERYKAMVNNEPLDISEPSLNVGASSFFIENGHWILIVISVIGLIVFFSQSTMLLIDAVSPLVSKRFEYLRSAVFKCASNEQYISFLNMKSKCNDRADIVAWLEYGNECLGDLSLDDIDEVIESLNCSEGFSGTIPSFLK